MARSNTWHVHRRADFLRARSDNRQAFGERCESKSLTRRLSYAVLRDHVDNLDACIESGNKYGTQFRRRAPCSSLLSKIAPNMRETSTDLRGEPPAAPGRSL